MNVLDKRLVEDVASRLRSDPGLVEKDWQVTRALSVLANLDHGGAQPAFGGGTSLSKAWGLIKRFSEDIDFKVAMPPARSRNQAKKERSAYREHVLAALNAAGFTLAGTPAKRDENRFFSAELLYPGLFAAGPGLRPHIRVEMLLEGSALPSVARPVTSLISLAQGRPPEVASFLCVDPVETAADKLSALAWRVQSRRRDSADDDPTIVRHIHDLAALKARVAASDAFTRLVHLAAEQDTGRGGEATAGFNRAALLASMLERLATDRLWADEYRDFVRQVSYAAPDEQIGFSEALSAVGELVALISTKVSP